MSAIRWTVSYRVSPVEHTTTMHSSPAESWRHRRPHPMRGAFCEPRCCPGTTPPAAACLLRPSWTSASRATRSGWLPMPRRRRRIRLRRMANGWCSSTLGTNGRRAPTSNRIPATGSAISKRRARSCRTMTAARSRSYARTSPRVRRTLVPLSPMSTMPTHGPRYRRASRRLVP